MKGLHLLEILTVTTWAQAHKNLCHDKYTSICLILNLSFLHNLVLRLNIYQYFYLLVNVYRYIYIFFCIMDIISIQEIMYLIPSFKTPS